MALREFEMNPNTKLASHPVRSVSPRLDRQTEQLASHDLHHFELNHHSVGNHSIRRQKLKINKRLDKLKHIYWKVINFPLKFTKNAPKKNHGITKPLTEINVHFHCFEPPWDLKENEIKRISVYVLTNSSHKFEEVAIR